MLVNFLILIGTLILIVAFIWWLVCNGFPISDSKIYVVNWNWVKWIQKKFNDRVDKWMEYERGKK